MLSPAACGDSQRARGSQTDVRVRGGRREIGYAGPVDPRVREEGVSERSPERTEGGMSR